ncbi:SPOR domain-containing protein [Methylobacterium haplocladii]|uniref:SPOR domain-containing protein n=1 Tax=Methylobacterium haplocladii TaxID=1176176 RepID=A0A512IP60_9HYPH|nr:SPOR domain-containing protein [Methylobacterium haplocladii]GEO99452.1 hypothetical protein MHA02_18400 [Methylobacterium haplocladii]GJD83281.1 hypothetical protein HPGCJGGD_1147 [Methylobacterium haplocladii]GLS58929.1 hypothetical protein GCM10007887_15950 [Methylobacterium haplocladii]
MTTSASRAPIDFDAFERDLRQSSLPQTGAPTPSRADPLAELARIVGQDDPFRALLASQGAQPGARVSAGTQAGRIEPAFFHAPQAQHEVTAQPAQSPADAFDQYLATVEQGAYAEDDGHDQHDPAAFDDSGKGYRAVAAQHPRRKLVQVGAGLGVLVLCVTGALGWKAMGSHGSSGGPVTVLADKTPLKVAPQAADGVEIPDQNKQIYERNAKDGQIKVVNREEQPLDVAQAARSAGRDGASGGTTPGNTAMLTDSLGEPRRVRTVSVKPDTPVTAASQVQSQPSAQPQTQRVASADPVGQAPASPIPTMMMPDASEGSASQASRRPQRALASTTVPAKPAPVQTADASGATPPMPAAEAAPRKAVQRVASVSPETTASTDAAPAATASTASVGGFSVQIGVRASDADARSAFRQMQGKFSQLSGKPELIQQAEVGGKSIYRVRVGPLAKAEANSLCTDLKGAGGQCFVAKN